MCQQQSTLFTRNTGLLMQSIACSGLLFAASSAGASLLTNGDFEDVSGTFPNGWTDSGGEAELESTSSSAGVISGLESLRIGGSSGGAKTTIDQTIGTELSDFVFSWDWRRPFTNFPDGDHMNVHVANGSSTPFINIRVHKESTFEASVELFDGGWTDLDPDGVGTATETIVGPQTVYSFTITGRNFGTTEAEYDLSVVGGTLDVTYTGLTLFQNDPFSLGEEVNNFRFVEDDNSATYDNAVVTPEPTSLALLALGGLCAFSRRRD